MHNLHIEGLSDELVQAVTASFNVLNRNGEATIISDTNEIGHIVAELADVKVNLLYNNAELLNVVDIKGRFIIQLKTLMRLPVNFSKYGNVTDITDYFLSQCGYAKSGADHGIIHIEPKDGLAANNYVAKLLSHIFTSHDMVISGHEKFNSLYTVYAADKQRAVELLSDRVLDAICRYKGLHITFSGDKVVIWAQELDENSTAAIMNIFDALSIGI